MTWLRMWCWRLRKDSRRFLPEVTPSIYAAAGRHFEADRHDRYLPEAR